MAWKKILGGVVGAVVLVIGGGLTFLELKTPAQRAVLADKKFEVTPQRLERGKYLADGILECTFCHSEHDWTTHGGPVLPGAVGAGWAFPWAENKMPGKITVPNITPDVDTGAGGWPDDMLARAIREGIRHDGHAMFLMPSKSFSGLSDEDIASVVVFVRSLAPVKKERPLTVLDPPVRWLIKFAPTPITAPVAEPVLTDAVARGARLAKLGHCSDCHTTVDDHHKDLPGMAYAGGQEFRGPWGLTRSANLTPDASGIAHYDEALFMKVIRTGNIGGRRLSPFMPWNWVRKLSDADLKDLWAFLQTVKPVKHEVNREDVPQLKDNPEVREHG